MVATLQKAVLTEAWRCTLQEESGGRRSKEGTSVPERHMPTIWETLNLTEQDTVSDNGGHPGQAPKAIWVPANTFSLKYPPTQGIFLDFWHHRNPPNNNQIIQAKAFTVVWIILKRNATVVWTQDTHSSCPAAPIWITEDSIFHHWHSGGAVWLDSLDTW